MDKLKILIISIVISLLSACGTTSYKNSNNIRSEKINGTLNTQQKQEITMVAFSMLDVRYNWGGKRPDFGLDCSGLVTNVYKKAVGLNLTGAARHMAQQGKDIPLSYYHKKNLEPGDLLFFNTTGKSFSHVGIYIGEGKFLHASSGKGKVIVSKIDNNYYQQRIERIRRM